MEYQDRQITCIDCSQPFVFSAGEQEFYARKGFREEPKRCKPCREARKQRRESGGYAAPRQGAGMNGGGGGNRAYGNGNGGEIDDDIGNRAPSAARGPREVREVRGGGGGRPASREMYDAVCASCGAPARVPFRPVAGRPVYCRDCYSSQSDGR
jgi:CxxC-x17-CxxC domain-containing protein